MNFRYILTVSVLLGSLMTLSACSEDQGWTIIEHKSAPYGENRTAGSGIKYVRAYLMPEKGPVTDPIMEEVDALLKQHMETAHISLPSAEPMFQKSQIKGK